MRIIIGSNDSEPLPRHLGTFLPAGSGKRDSQFFGVEDCPALEIRVGQTIGEAVRLQACTCAFCDIVRSDEGR